MCTSFVPYSPSDHTLIALWVEDAKTTMELLLTHLKNRHPRQYGHYFECDTNQLLSDVFTFINSNSKTEIKGDPPTTVLQHMQMTIDQIEQRVLSIAQSVDLLQANDTPSKRVKPRARRQRKASASTQKTTSADPSKAITVYLNRPFTDPMVPTTKLFNEFKEWCVTNNCTINKDGMTYTEFVSTVKSVCAFYIMVGATLYVKAPNKMIVKIEV